MISTRLTLEDFVVGHTWTGIPAIIRVDTPSGGVAGPPATSLDLLEMVWKKIGTGAEETFTLSSDGLTPEITITDAVTWESTIPKAILPLATAGRWEWLLSGTGADGSKDPLLSGVVTVHTAP